MTVLEAIQKSSDFLAKKGVDSPRLQTELLLAHLLKLPRMQLYLNFERALSPAETDALREMIKRRGVREPLQHIVGSTSFCGLDLRVNRHALIPRPETELLAEEAWKFLQGRAGTELTRDSSELHAAAGSESQPYPSTTLDFGTGTGCIAIAIAAKCPGANIVALDISPEALALAKTNAEKNQVADRIEFVHGDGFAAVGSARSFDLIASNPPYIASAEIETLQPEVRDFDPRGALDGGPDGLDFYRMLAKQAKPFLKPEGKVMLEFGDGQAEDIRNIFQAENWIVEAVKADYSQRERILIAKISSSSSSS